MNGTTPHGSPKRPRGRPPRLNQQLIDSISNFVKTGCYFETAAIASGVPKPTFYLWLKLAHAHRAAKEKAETTGEAITETPFQRNLLKFLDAIERAASEAELADLITIRTASKDNWQAAAWRLERKHPGKWGRRDTMVNEHTGADGGPIQTENSDTSGLKPGEEDALLKRHYERITRLRDQDPARAERAG